MTENPKEQTNTSEIEQNVVEKINTSPEPINLPQDENDKVIQAIDPFKLIIIVSSIFLFLVLTIFIGLLIFCLRGEKKMT